MTSILQSGRNAPGADVLSLRRNFWRGVWRVLLRKPTRMLGVVVIAMFGLMAVFGPMLYPEQLPHDIDNIYAPMSLEHPFGTDEQGTDVLSLVIVGSRYVIFTAVIAALISLSIGALVGLYAGFRRGVPDSVLMRIADVFITLPTLPLLIVLSTLWSFNSPVDMGLAIGIFNWGRIARAVRSQTLSLRERGFIEAARGLGLPTRHIVVRQLLPNMAPYVAMNLLVQVTHGIYDQVGLFFLGVLPYEPGNWGGMLNQAVFKGGALAAPDALPWMLGPLIAILLLTLGIVLVVDAMDEIFNPRLREE